jgi:predicted aspartyl protease
MGFTHVPMIVTNPADRARREPVSLLVDSGAVYSIVPAPVLERLGIAAEREDDFALADGRPLVRRLGIAGFELGGHHACSNVIFGEPDDCPLLGIVTLEELGYMLDPVRRRLMPLPMRLGRLDHASA